MGFLYRGLLFAVGLQAFEEGIPRAQNPYGPYSPEAHAAWDDGWLSAQEAFEGCTLPQEFPTDSHAG
ncbi:hypothetical protein ACELLULO517_01185 [Acidisoma cellulosilytica]|uniref:Uncharacterized protein n=1 Tax=Acidisoma cellulosilyticum TaxID=2802395 RepID=A0A963YXW7_9PROT|nr:hypothetical protein [Acidisoma cellulosilyticum]MCB8878829.1 hypothetical protein [Acidisoma cellulosilyticum]